MAKGGGWQASFAVKALMPLALSRERKGVRWSRSVSTTVGNANEQRGSLCADRQRSNEIPGWQLKLDKLRVNFRCAFVNEGNST